MEAGVICAEVLPETGKAKVTIIGALSPFGIRRLDIPFTPVKVWQAIQKALAGD